MKSYFGGLLCVTWSPDGRYIATGGEDDLITFSTSSSSASLLTYSRRSPPKKPKFIVTSEEMNEFFKLLLHTDIQNFLIRDSCCLISDKVKFKNTKKLI